MEFENIDKIIVRYFEGQSSLEEELLIRKFFSSNSNLSEKYKRLKEMFMFYQSAGEEKSQLSIDTIIPAKKRVTKSRRLISYGLAASIALMIAMFFSHDNNTEKQVYAYINGQPVENHEIAFEEAQKALLLISTNLNEGTQNLNHLSEFSRAEELLSTN